MVWGFANSCMLGRCGGLRLGVEMEGRGVWERGCYCGGGDG